MSFGRVVHESVADRRRAYLGLLERSKRSGEKAVKWVEENMPEARVDSEPGVNPLVLAVAIMVRDVDGPGNVTPGRVRERLRSRFPDEYELLYGSTERERTTA